MCLECVGTTGMLGKKNAVTEHFKKQGEEYITL